MRMRRIHAAQSTRKFLQDQNCYLNAGKISVLLRLLEDYRKAERKILIFSQVRSYCFNNRFKRYHADKPRIVHTDTRHSSSDFEAQGH